jgi:uncharacterized damage-inducible protein DinB
MASRLATPIKTVMLRELRALEREIAAYPDDESVWRVPPGVSNSAGNLALHMCGNLRHFIGHALAGTGYVRDRNAEFSAKGMTREQLRSVIEESIAELGDAFEKITDAHLQSEFPLPIMDNRFRTQDFLTHLAVHLSYHLGQVDYHRRIITGSTTTVGTVDPRELNL